MVVLGKGPKVTPLRDGATGAAGGDGFGNCSCLRTGHRFQPPSEVDRP